MQQQKEHLITESEVLMNITQKLADIRKNLGIEDNDDLSEIRLMQNSFKTPSDDSNQFEVDHNTFGKQQNLPALVSHGNLGDSLQDKSRIIISHISPPMRETFKSQATHMKITDDQQDKLREQIMLLEDQLNVLRQMGLSRDQGLMVETELNIYKQNVVELEQRNTQLQIQISQCAEQLEYSQKQSKLMEKKLLVQQTQYATEVQILKENILTAQKRQQVLLKKYKLSDKINDYIDNLEVQLNEYQKEIQLLASRVTKEQTEMAFQKDERKIVERNIKKELDSLYKQEINDLKLIINKWQSPQFLLNKNNGKRAQPDYVIPQETQKTKYISDDSLKAVYERRITNYKCTLQKYSERCNYSLNKQQVHKLQEFFFQTINSLQKDLQRTKQSVLDDQTLVYSTFENLITSIYEEFVKEKQILLNTVDEMRRSVKVKERETLQMKARIKNYDYLLN